MAYFMDLKKSWKCVVYVLMIISILVLVLLTKFTTVLQVYTKPVPWTSVTPKTILLYTHLEPESDPYFKLTNCSYHCHISRNTSNIELADAVIFSPRTMWEEKKPGFRRFVFPKYRSPDQYWVFFLFDWHIVGMFKYFLNDLDTFNLSMTWKQESDVPIGYGYFEAVATNIDMKFFYDEISKKTKLVSWVVSSCATASRREVYVRELSKYIKVDIFGHCGQECGAWNAEDCFQKLSKIYKFYLSFENSICSGYMTEKLFRAYEYNMVPIVLGGTNYSQVLPPGSFINVLDFKTPKLLASYLLKLNDDQDLYRAYFEWKKTFKVHHTSEALPRGVCQLCQFLHDPNHLKRTIPDIKEHVLHDCNDKLIPNLSRSW